MTSITYLSATEQEAVRDQIFDPKRETSYAPNVFIKKDDQWEIKRPSPLGRTAKPGIIVATPEKVEYLSVEDINSNVYDVHIVDSDTQVGIYDARRSSDDPVELIFESSAPLIKFYDDEKKTLARWNKNGFKIYRAGRFCFILVELKGE